MTEPRKSVTGKIVPHPPTRLQRLVARTVYLAITVDAATQRFRIADPHRVLDTTAREPALFAIWHNRLAFSLIIHRRFIRPTAPGHRLAALCSASRDGALLSAVLEAFGVQPVRGSSSRRGAQALVELRSWADRGLDLAITPDGPRGPRYQAQPGLIALARATRRPIIPVGCNTPWKICLRSWDRFQIPLPFAPTDVVFGRPIAVAGDTPAAMEEARCLLQQELDAVTRDTFPSTGR